MMTTQKMVPMNTQLAGGENNLCSVSLRSGESPLVIVNINYGV